MGTIPPCTVPRLTKVDAGAPSFPEFYLLLPFCNSSIQTVVARTLDVLAMLSNMARLSSRRLLLALAVYTAGALAEDVFAAGTTTFIRASGWRGKHFLPPYVPIESRSGVIY